MKDLVFGLSRKSFPAWKQIRYFSKVISPKERVVFRIASVFLFLSLCFVATVAYVNATEKVPVPGGRLKEAVIGSPQYINPILSPSSDVDSDMVRLMFSSLFVYDASNQLVPDLVSSYSISEDKKTYTFFLRSGALFHDGEPLTSDDVIFTLAAIENPSNMSPLRSIFKDILFVKIDETIFSLTTPEPQPDFFSNLTFGILPEHLWNNVVNMELVEYNLRPVGSGPWKFQELARERSGNIQSYTLERNQDYYGKKPYLDELTFVFYPDTAAALTDLSQKKVDSLAFLTYNDREEMKKSNRRSAFARLRLPEYVAIFFNQKKAPVLQDDAVREALGLSVPRDRLIQESLFSEGEPVYGPILETFFGHKSIEGEAETDFEKAKQILEESDWSLPEGETYRKKNGRILEFTVKTLRQEPFLSTLTLLQQTWESLGVKMNIEAKDFSELEVNIQDRDYEALLFGEILGHNTDPYLFWSSSQNTPPGLALAIFPAKETDVILEAARKTFDDNERSQKYQDFLQKMFEIRPALFLYNPYYFYAVDKKILGITFPYIARSQDRFAGLSEWYIKTKRVWKK